MYIVRDGLMAYGHTIYFKVIISRYALGRLLSRYVCFLSEVPVAYWAAY